jgi:predicted Rossmann fold flavoprotein
VVLLERTPDGGKKILMSGGGRCNVLPSELDPARYVTASSPHTMKKLLLSWPLAGQRCFFESELAMPLALEQETGKLFPVSNKAKDVRDGLRALAERLGVTTRFGEAVERLDPATVRPGWRVGLRGGVEVEASRVIIATGGLSVPATGSDGLGLQMARRLGHAIHETYPALTPLTATPHRYAPLAGVSLSVTLEAPGPKRGASARGGFLFTHKGYSGPSVLNLSHLAILSRRGGGPPQPFFVQWTDRGRDDWDRMLRAESGTVGSLLRRHIPARLAEALLEDVAVPPATSLSQLGREARRRTVDAMTRHPLPWTGDEGYVKAEVTGGGVALGEVEPRTLESRIHPGLYLCGEILDAFGPIGGYNFAWAWATGRLAGEAARRSLGGGNSGDMAQGRRKSDPGEGESDPG